MLPVDDTMSSILYSTRIRGGLAVAGYNGRPSVMSMEKNAILAEAQRRILLEEREALIQIEMDRLRKAAKESSCTNLTLKCSSR